MVWVHFAPFPAWLNVVLLLAFFAVVLPAALNWLFERACRPPGKDPSYVSYCDDCQDYHGPVNEL